MTITATPSLPQLPKHGKVQIVNGDGTTYKTAYAGGSNGSKVLNILAVNTDTVSHDVQIAVTRAAVNYVIGTVTVGASAGNSGSLATVNLLANIPLPVDSDGNRYLFLNDNSDTLQVSVVSPMAGGTTLNLVAVGADW